MIWPLPPIKNPGYACATFHAIIDILSTCYANIERKLYSVLFLLDLAKAFNKVDHNFLLQKLDHYRLKGIVKNNFKSD